MTAAKDMPSSKGENSSSSSKVPSSFQDHLRRLNFFNYFMVGLFAWSMGTFLNTWKKSEGGGNALELALPGVCVLASMTYLFGFFGIYIISGSEGVEEVQVGQDGQQKQTKEVAQTDSSSCCTSSATSLAQQIIVVGAGTAGASAAVALARAGRKVLLLERDMGEQDRIVGELLQPGGVEALREMGLEECASSGCDSVRVDGYVVIRQDRGDEAVLYYPRRQPKGLMEMLGVGEGTEASKEVVSEDTPRGRSFHNCKFVTELRKVAAAEPNITFVEGTVTGLLREEGKGESGRVLGVSYRAGGEERTALAPMTLVADGIWSGLRKVCNTHKPEQISSFVGVVVQHPAMQSPVPFPHCGHVVLSHPSPTLIYQISPTETRVLVDVMGRMPSAATGALAEFLASRASTLPECFCPAYLEAVERGSFKSMPNRALAPSTRRVPGCVLVGDALNMRHPLTGGGMTVALKDVALLTSLLNGVDLEDDEAVGAAVSRFHLRRKGHSAAINVLANALYGVFSTPEGDGQETREQLQAACFDYLKMGGAYSAGPVGLLAGLSPSPTVLSIHFFMVALYGVRTHLLPFGWLRPSKIRDMYRLLHVACIIIMPLLTQERSTVLSLWPVRMLVNAVFPFTGAGGGDGQ